MAEGETDEPDASSIKPVSSLRSQFESLYGVSATESRPKPPVKPQALRPSFRLDPAPLLPSPRRSFDVPSLDPGPHSMAVHGDPHRPLTPTVRRRAPSPPKPRSRPTSMILIPTPKQAKRISPPSVNVLSPESSPKSGAYSKLSPTGSGRGGIGAISADSVKSASNENIISPNRSQVRRGASASPSVTRQSLDLPRLHPRRDHSSLSSSDNENRGRSGPPPVNRAAKPKVSGHTFGVGATTRDPSSTTASQGRKISPFHTPPSSDEYSPMHSPDESQSSPPLAKASKPMLPTINKASTPEVGMHRAHNTIAGERSETSSTPRFANHSDVRPSLAEDQAPALPPRRILPASPSRPETFDKGTNLNPKPSALTMGFVSKPTSTDASLRPAHHSQQGPPEPTLRLARAQPSPIRANFEGQITSQSHQARNDVPRAPYADRSTISVATFTDLPEYPDSSRANRRPPCLPDIPRTIPIGYDTRLFSVCGELVCVAGVTTRVYELLTGKLLLSMPHAEHTRVTALCFRPTRNVEDDGMRIWLGTNWGEILEIDIGSKQVVASNTHAHQKREITKMHRHGAEVWSLDEEGKLYVWPPKSDGAPSLSECIANGRVARRPTASVVVGDELWLAFGKEIKIIKPSAQIDISGQQSSLQRDVIQTSSDVTSGTTISDQPDKVYFGRMDGKVAVFSRSDGSCLEVVSVSLYRISCVVGVGSYLWTGHSTGTIIVHDTTRHPWLVKKEWSAQETPVSSIALERDSLWKLGQMPVVTLGSSSLHMWDGLLQDDWIGDDMHAHENDYCKFSPLTSLVLTWNVGASKPGDLRYDEKDSNFFRDLLDVDEAPDILVFGLQELVDLEDKALTAKTFFKSRYKDSYGQEQLGSVYRSWRDYLSHCLDDYMPVEEPYTILHTASLVGLFTCIFIKASVRMRVKDLQASEVKTGMGGLHGNKGAIVVRVVLDDSSLCFVNCHLAAGQNHTASRNNDVVSILETSSLPSTRAPTRQSEVFVNGGDGSMILDCETCILNGDLNYRIDTISRDSAVSAIKQGNLSKLLERDQLLVSRRKNPGFRLRSFQEGQITFAPTYKYDVGTDTYDTSEKRRAPAWCDRILYRGKVKQLDYSRHEVRISDHRPVSGRFELQIKTVQQDRRVDCLKASEHKFEAMRKDASNRAKLDYLHNMFGLSPEEARKLLEV